MNMMLSQCAQVLRESGRGGAECDRVCVCGAAGVPFADLYSHITARCGATYKACDICDNEAVLWPPGAPPGSHCGYHYTPAGYSYISEFLSGVYASLI